MHQASYFNAPGEVLLELNKKGLSWTGRDLVSFDSLRCSVPRPSPASRVVVAILGS